MKKKTIVKSALLSLMMIATENVKAQNLGMCTYDAAGNRLERFTYVDDSYNRSLEKMGGKSELANERMGHHTVSVDYNSEGCMVSIEVLGLSGEDYCFASVYNLMGIKILGQHIVEPRTEISLYDYNKGVYLLRLELNGENRCWKIIKK